ncbi:hypothetical protein [Pseudomonas sp.]|nr:hypothetical protein [Pseudomonas sp.]
MTFHDGAAAEVHDHAEAMADMFCAYLNTLNPPQGSVHEPC